MQFNDFFILLTSAKGTPLTEKINNGFIIVFFLSALLSNFIFSQIGWTHTILDMYGFRQSQTAISVFYLLKEGFRLDYITPVLGAPWSIPLEFPIYQYVVATLVRVSNMHLDQAGRLINLICFYASLLPIFSIINIFVKNKIQTLIFLSLILINPAYIFWSRAFMIESTALFFSAMYLHFYLSTIDRPKLISAVFACIFGVLGGLTKSTTAILFLSASVILGVYIVSMRDGWKSIFQVFRTYLLSSILIFVVILTSIFSWTAYADIIKQQNSLANGFLTSSSLSNWNFGTVQQKLSLSTWKQIFDFTMINSFRMDHIWLLVLLLLAWLIPVVFRMKFWRESLIFLAIYMTGPLIFTNLYFVHHYYYYANMIFLLCSLGFSLASVYSCSRITYKYINTFLVIPLITFLMNFPSSSFYYPAQITNNLSLEPVTSYIKNNSSINDVPLIYGYDWDPSVAYYSERKAIMIAPSLVSRDEKIMQTITTTGKDRIRLMIVKKNIQMSDVDTTFIADKVNYFGFKLEPEIIGDTYIYHY